MEQLQRISERKLCFFHRLTLVFATCVVLILSLRIVSLHTMDTLGCLLLLALVSLRVLHMGLQSLMAVQRDQKRRRRLHGTYE